MKPKVPRKKKKQIPEGPYCYKFVRELWEGKEYKGIRIKSCPFYKHIDGLEGHCRLLNEEITDQLKDCSINWPKK